MATRVNFALGMLIASAPITKMYTPRLNRRVALHTRGRHERAFAEAEARATEMVSNAIASSGNQAINYFVAQEYTKAVGKFADSPNAKTILFPVEATQLIGSLGGIGELMRGAFDKAEGPADTGTPIAEPRDRAPVRRPSVPPSRNG